MILTVTLNPAIDKILVLNNFEVHKLHRLQAEEVSLVVAGGKGVNIAQALRKMGNEVIASGFAGGYTGHLLCDTLRQADITTNFIFTQGSTRTNISILDQKNKTLTEINDVGQEISEDDIRFFLENYERMLVRVEVVAIAGSLPKGVTADIYDPMIRKANELGKKVIVHVPPGFTEALIKSRPFLINPDMRSDHHLMGREVDGIAQFLDSGKSILNQSPGCEFVVFTHRIENVVAVTPGKSYILRPQGLKIVSMLGYGDAWLAGFIHAFVNGESVEDALCYASAAGLTNVEDLHKEIGDVGKIKMNLPRIMLEVV